VTKYLGKQFKTGRNYFGSKFQRCQSMRPGIISEAVALHIEKVSPVVRQYIMAEGYGRAKLPQGSTETQRREGSGDKTYPSKVCPPLTCFL
jgi:hypothetical protein